MDRKAKNVFTYNSNRPPGGPLSLNQSPPAPPLVSTNNHDSHLYMITPAPDRTDHGHNSQGNNTNPSPMVTLTGGRQRPKAKNDYVDTPQSTKEIVLPRSVSQGNNNKKSKLLLPSHHTQQPQQVFLEPVVCNQPKSLLKTSSEETKGSSTAEDRDGSTNHEQSFVCPHCQKCRCDMCTTPRELPKTWLGRDKCECSVQKVGEYCLCMCCVQLFFQTMFNDSEDQQDVADDPCGCCEQRHCCKRWTCMLCFLPCLPGLLFYPCFKGGLALCTKCYNRCNNPGCRCKKERVSGNQRPLLDSESSST